MSVYVSKLGRKVYHRQHCRCLSNIPTDNIVYETQARLLRLGYRPCKVCMPNLENRIDDETHILDQFCKDKDIRFILYGGSILLNTDIGFWKIIRMDESYIVYHGNSFPTEYYPRNNRRDYHEQRDINSKHYTNLTDILIYIYSHDNFRRDELMNLRRPKNGGSKSQKKHYNSMKKKKQAYERCRSLQLLDKVSNSSL